MTSTSIVAARTDRPYCRSVARSPESGDTPRMSELSGAEPRRVSWLELFYDLVAVASIVTFSDAISGRSQSDVIGVVAAAAAAVWWIWLTTTLFANRYRVDDEPQRVVVLVQMLLLTMIALLVGDGLESHEGSASILYGLLCLSVAVMYARQVRRAGALGALARARRGQFAVAAALFVAAGIADGPVRYGVWIVAFALIVVPGIAYRFGRERGEAPIDAAHLVERLGLLTIIVLGESFVKVSLLAADGNLERLDLIVLGALFAVVFAMWWSYFDDIPDAGLPNDVNRMRGWVFGHLLLQVCLVGIAVGYAKLLQLDLGHTVSFDKMMLTVGTLFGAYLGLALIGACTRRVPIKPLLMLRVGSALILVPVAVLVWRVEWVDVDSTAIFLALFALVHGAVATALRRSTSVLPAPLSATNR
jgi:low temperature requirement protein LtrA